MAVQLRYPAEQNAGVALEGETTFTGYEHLTDQATVIALFREGEPVQTLEAEEEGLVVLDRTPFYAESGGQTGDSGVLVAAGGEAFFNVADTRKQGGEVFGHLGKQARGSLHVGDAVAAEVAPANRHAIALNHSATHLLHAALRQVLGDHVQQKGSLVDDEKLRFDFSHFQPMTNDELRQIEDSVNQHL